MATGRASCNGASEPRGITATCARARAGIPKNSPRIPHTNARAAPPQRRSIFRDGFARKLLFLPHAQLLRKKNLSVFLQSFYGSYRSLQPHDGPKMLTAVEASNFFRSLRARIAIKIGAQPPMQRPS